MAVRSTTTFTVLQLTGDGISYEAELNAPAEGKLLQVTVVKTAGTGTHFDAEVLQKTGGTGINSIYSWEDSDTAPATRLDMTAINKAYKNADTTQTNKLYLKLTARGGSIAADAEIVVEPERMV